VRQTGTAAPHPRHDVRDRPPVQHTGDPHGTRAHPPGVRGGPDDDHVGVLAGVEAVAHPHAPRVADAREEGVELARVVGVRVLALGAAAAAAADRHERTVGTPATSTPTSRHRTSARPC